MSDHLSPFPWIDVIVILALILLNAVLAMSELAVVSSRDARLKAMARSGSRGAQVALDLAADPGRFLSTVQTGITLIAVFAGAYSGTNLGEPTAQRVEQLGLDPQTARQVGFTLVIVLVTYVSLVIGELVPKQLALRSPEPIAAAVSRPMLWLSRISAPVVWALERSPGARRTRKNAAVCLMRGTTCNRDPRRDDPPPGLHGTSGTSRDRTRFVAAPRPERAGRDSWCR